MRSCNKGRARKANGLHVSLITLSGGECRCLKLATELHKAGSIYLMDEQTTSLHLSDIAHVPRSITGSFLAMHVAAQ
jgi:excinuclease UvrABC ATPase subunit